MKSCILDYMGCGEMFRNEGLDLAAITTPDHLQWAAGKIGHR